MQSATKEMCDSPLNIILTVHYIMRQCLVTGEFFLQRQRNINKNLVSNMSVWLKSIHYLIYTHTS